VNGDPNDLAALRRELSDAYELVRAIRAGEVDAFVEGDRDTYRVRTLEGADSPYRVLVEAMRQGAATTTADGTVLYANRHLREMLGLPADAIVGRPISQCLGMDASTVTAMLGGTPNAEPPCEITIRSGSDALHLVVSAHALRDHGAVPTFCFILTDVTERKAVEAREAASARERELREMFVGILGHDLRSPLQVIVSAASLLKRKAGTPEEAKLPDAILRACARMTRLTEDMLDMTLSRLGGGMPIKRAEVDLSDVVTGAVDEVSNGSPARFAMKFEGDTTGRWDRARLAQVLSNLLTNAVTYGAPSEVIGIRVDGCSAHEVEVAVTNRGEPIPDELLPVIFDPFRRGDSSTRRKGDGAGLGLFIAEQIVRAHGGTIAVRSSREEGTTFAFTLPRATSS
jgi:PAS domain S-box-containing protein